MTIGKTEVTAEQALEALREVVATFGPDYVYKQAERGDPYSEAAVQCKYVENDGPSCIVGHVAFKLGVPLEKLKKWDYGEDQSITVVGEGVFDPAARSVLAEAQQCQDLGEPWGKVLRLAELTLEDFGS